MDDLREILSTITDSEFEIQQGELIVAMFAKQKEQIQILTREVESLKRWKRQEQMRKQSQMMFSYDEVRESSRSRHHHLGR